MLSTVTTVLCYGDSNTWGYNPAGGSRFPVEVRWPGVLQCELGEEFRIIEEGLNGRTTVWDDPLMPGRNGSAYLLPCLESHRPLDQVVLFFGLNDLKKRFSATAEDTARGAGQLMRLITASGTGPADRAPGVLVVAPPSLGRLSGYAEQFEGAVERSGRVAEYLEAVARESNCAFLNAAGHVALSDIDGFHLDAPSHAVLAKAIARRLRELQR